VVSIEKATSIILEHIPVLGLEKIDLLYASGRVLGEAIIARYSIPSNDISTMDGFALMEEDIRGAGQENPLTLKVCKK